MNLVYLLIGGNMGDRMHYLTLAREGLAKTCGKITNESAIYETEAWGIRNQELFLNQAVEMDTRLSAHALLSVILQTEKALGRKREVKYGPRLIDIDILFYNSDIIASPGLTIPHPELQNRRFALQCLDDIAPYKIHPVLGKTVRQLLAETTDPLAVNKIY